MKKEDELLDPLTRKVTVHKRDQHHYDWAATRTYFDSVIYGL